MNRVRWITGLCICLVVISSGWMAATVLADDTASSSEAEQLIAKADAEFQTFVVENRPKGRDRTEWQAFQEKMKDPDLNPLFKHIPDIQSYADSNKNTEDGLTCAVWVFTTTMNYQPEERENALPLFKTLVSDYKDCTGLVDVLDVSRSLPKESLMDVVKFVHDTATQPQVKARALLGKYRVATFNKDQGASDSALNEMLENYSDIKLKNMTVKNLVEGYRRPKHEAAALAKGEMAPEIIGLSVDGEPMKLSDYRGKVVVLDFWGFW